MAETKSLSYFYGSLRHVSPAPNDKHLAAGANHAGRVDAHLHDLEPSSYLHGRGDTSQRCVRNQHCG